MHLDDPSPEIHSFPTQDVEFHRDVQTALTHSRVTIRAGRDLLEAVRQDLAERYPTVQIREQETFASLGGARRWYVYRDGKLA
jgi:hypothetical protein